MNASNYILVEWPEVQDLMDEPWFQEEAVLHPELSSAYFIPEIRILNTNDLILKRIQELTLEMF